jgi:FkbM family methyltransferase
MSILRKLKSNISSYLRSLGYELHKIEYRIRDERLKTLWLENLGIKTVLDIGANEGQFARYIHNILPEAMIYSFEPLQDCYEVLNTNLSSLSRFRAFNLALGAETGEVSINRSNFSQCSSLLPMLELHEESFPISKGSWEEKIKVVRLDDIASELTLEKPLLIKMDVQGLEDRVIAGGIEVIKEADILIVELSTTPLYQNQLLFDEMYALIKQMGFKYQGNLVQLHSPNDGKILQIDGIFVRD